MIDPILTGAQPTAISATATAEKSSKATGLASDFETFLKMLTAQARYQDPLEPIDSTEYASQLAQFSMVEQQVQSNDTLAALSQILGGSNPASLAAYVGMEARAVTPITYTGQPIEVSVSPSLAADQAVLVVRNAQGGDVQRVPLSLSDTRFVWDGTGSDGSTVTSEPYSFHVENYKEGELLTTDSAAAYGRVTEAQIQNGQIMLVLESGQIIPASMVTALKEPTQI